MRGLILRATVLAALLVGAVVTIAVRETRRTEREYRETRERLFAAELLPAENVWAEGMVDEPTELSALADRAEDALKPSAPAGLLEPLECLRALVEHPLAQAALAEGRSVLGGTRARPRIEHGPARELLWARVHAAAREGRERDAVRGLTLFLDLRLLSDERRWPLCERNLNEERAWLAELDAALASGLDARALARELDPRLARLASPERFRAALTGEYGRNFDEQWRSRIGDPQRAAAQTRAFDAGLQALAAPCAGPGAPARRADGWLAIDVPHGSTHELLDLERAAHPARRALTLARVALALAAERAEEGEWPASLDALSDRFEGAVPLDPCTRRPFLYRLDADGVELACEAGFASAAHAPGAMGWPPAWRFSR